MNRFCIVLLLLCAFAAGARGDFPKGYYDRANGKRKAELKASLHDIIRTASVLGYGSGSGKTWSGFYVTDRTADNYCVDRYSPNKRQFTSAGTPPAGMNIEHSFAKSWWGGTQVQAYFDLFNLMPSDSEANSRKSNYAMGEVVSVSHDNGSIRIGKCREVTNNVWEPEDRWKGDFARTYMYMVTCYSDLTWRSNGLDQLENNEWPTFNDWTMDMVLRWSRQDPVDEIELARNEAVYGIQGNRNPFVDFPNLCEYVWGDSVDYDFKVDGSATVAPADEVVLFGEELTSGLGAFADVKADGTPGSIWRSDSRYGAVANAYSLGKVADNYLVADIDLTDCTSATLTFTHQTGYNAGVDVRDTYFSVLVTDDYSGTPAETSWEVLDAAFPAPPSSGWTQAVESGKVSLSTFAGRLICLAFRYTSTADACYGWEVRDVKITGTPVRTGIIGDVVPLRPDAAGGRVYDLTGRRVSPSRVRGVYLMNGNIYIR
ncbi:MAG: endonuclease [Bacteroidaceae bacterium]|nr:endonuclease [Bacteroidaceae bacterium]